MTSNKRAIIKVSINRSKSTLGINHSRRIYSILRRYTPEVVEGGFNICYAELTGLRTFFKMSYVQMMTVIKKEVEKETGHDVSVGIATIAEFESGKRSTKRSKISNSVSTYSEMNELFKGAHFIPKDKRALVSVALKTKKIRLTIPFLGKVS
jgi:hypothetical protein